MITAGLGVLWAVAGAGLSAVFVGSSLLRRQRRTETRIATLDTLGADFRRFRVEVPIRDGWYSHTGTKTVFARVNPNQPETPVVLSATCTHLGCTVRWENAASEFVCPCHGGRFDDSGRVLSGPPPSDLARVKTRVDGQDVYVDFG